MKYSATLLPMSRTMHAAFIALSESSDTAVSDTTMTTACTTVRISTSNIPDAWRTSRVDTAKAYNGHPNNTRFATVDAARNVGYRQTKVRMRYPGRCAKPL